MKENNEIQSLKSELNEIIDKQQGLSADINRGKRAGEEWKSLNERSNKIIQKLSKLIGGEDE